MLLEEAADLFEDHSAQFLSLCQREAGKTLIDGVLELREAVDFLRYYASEARRQFGDPIILPGPTGEENRMTLAGRGVFATISPWNFPLAIFIGPAGSRIGGGQYGHCQTGRTDPADRGAGGGTVPQGGAFRAKCSSCCPVRAMWAK